MFTWSKEVIFDASEDFTNFSEIGDYKKIILKLSPPSDTLFSRY